MFYSCQFPYSLNNRSHEFVAPKAVARNGMKHCQNSILEFRKVELEPNLVVSSKLGSNETGSTTCQKVSNDANNVVQIHLTEYALNQEIMFQSLIVLDPVC
jgi:hypothetical protein